MPRFGRGFPLHVLLGQQLQKATGAAAPTAAITGTATASITEADVVAGGKTIIITLTGDTWVAAGAAFDAERSNIIQGLDSAQGETLGWNLEVRDKEVVGAVIRTSDTVVTITLSASALYDITAQETITVTVPTTALTGGASIVGSPTFTVDVVIPVGGGYPTQMFNARPRSRVRSRR